MRVNERRRATALLARERELLEALMRSLQDGRRDHSKSVDLHTRKNLQPDVYVVPNCIHPRDMKGLLSRHSIHRAQYNIC